MDSSNKPDFGKNKQEILTPYIGKWLKQPTRPDEGWIIDNVILPAMEEYHQQAPGMKWRKQNDLPPVADNDGLEPRKYLVRFFDEDWRRRGPVTAGYFTAAEMIAIDFDDGDGQWEWLDESATPVQLPTEEEVSRAASKYATELGHYDFGPERENACTDFIAGFNFLASKLKGGTE